MGVAPVILWFRQDLRLADNPALARAAAEGAPIVPLYVLDEESADIRALGGASRWWLHHSLAALGADLQTRGGRLVLRRGAAETVLDRLIEETGARAVFWNRCYEPGAITRDQRIKSALKARGLDVESFNAALLVEPWALKTGQGGWFKVFSPFWRAAEAQLSVSAEVPTPERIETPTPVASDRLEDWGLLPTAPDWAGGLRAEWRPGEAGARARLEAFIAHALASYRDRRDFPGEPGTSRLSPHLHWGEIGPRQIWHALDRAGIHGKGPEHYRRELGWREFSYHLLYHFPALPARCLRPEFQDFPWSGSATLRRAWQRGCTGYPIVDAGMRQVWREGWMHNRVRMITASFLIKDLLVSWQAGEAWFWDTLVDADLANNAASWQWVAGCGADAAPFFRVFNPVLQSRKFDPSGRYLRENLPELAALPDAWIHEPWQAPAEVLAEAGVVLGDTYPRPIVDHGIARERALAAFQAVRTEA